MLASHTAIDQIAGLSYEEVLQLADMAAGTTRMSVRHKTTRNDILSNYMHHVITVIRERESLPLQSLSFLFLHVISVVSFSHLAAVSRSLYSTCAYTRVLIYSLPFSSSSSSCALDSHAPM